MLSIGGNDQESFNESAADARSILSRCNAPGESHAISTLARTARHNRDLTVHGEDPAAKATIRLESVMVHVRSSLHFIAVALLVMSGYAVGLGTGFVTIVGYHSETGSQQGFSSISWFPVHLSIPVWLDAGGTVRADYEVNAPHGSALLAVAPPLPMRSSLLQKAVVYVSGKRSGSITFVSQAPGWYFLDAAPSPIDGPRCPRERDMAETIIGSSDCPTYVVSYSVTWRLTNARATSAGTARIAIPRSGEDLSTLHIGN